jgi:putative ABC transport system substrate-binding protein
VRLNVSCFITAVALLFLAAPLAAEAQLATKVRRIGILTTSAPRSSAYLQAFEQGLHELGYVENQNLAIEFRTAEGKVDRLPALAAELGRLQVDIIVTQGTPAASAAKNATSTIPIVFAGAGDPVASGLVASLARPGGNLTGLSILAPDLSAKRLELLKEAVPKASRIAALHTGGTSVPLSLRPTEEAARSLGLQLQVLEVRGPDDFESAFAAAVRGRAQALVVLPSPILTYHQKPLVGLAAKHRLPALYQARDFVDAGGLMSYGLSLRDHFRRAATYVDKILRGAKPAELPVEQPMKFELVINMKTAKALGLRIPPALRLRADQIID